MNIPQNRVTTWVAVFGIIVAVGMLIFSASLTLNGEFALVRPQPVLAAGSRNLSASDLMVSLETGQALFTKNVTADSGSNLVQESKSVNELTPAQALGKEILEVTNGYRLINELSLDNIVQKYNQLNVNSDQGAAAQSYDDPEKVQFAMVQAWNDFYSPVSNFDELLMPEGIQNIQTAGQYGTRLLTRSYHLESNTAEIFENLYPLDLKGKNWLEITFNMHGYQVAEGDWAILGIEQPVRGDVHYTSLFDYLNEQPSGENTAYIPISALDQGGSPLNLADPVGSLHLRIWVAPGESVDILNVSAFYFQP